MSAIDECGVLIPAATLEDFPTDLSDYDARSLLAAWTVLWHPQLLAAQEQIPTWYRADSPPEPAGQRILTVPHPSLAQLPERYEAKSRQSEGCQWITGADRQEMLAALSLDVAPEPVAGNGRSICVDDFFAVGFAILQIQVMTRRLRYTSNLDEIHLQNRVVAAAKAFLKRDGQTAIEAMHDVFDCLAEERDHYFSSDPHLIDMTLMTETTVDSLLEVADFSGNLPGVIFPAGSEAASAAVTSTDSANTQSANSEAAAIPQSPTADSQGIGSSQSSPPLPTPMNVLIDHDVAVAISKLDPDRSAPLRKAIGDGILGWAGGGPASKHCLDAMTYGQAEKVFRNTYDLTTNAVGTAPTVFARFSGSTPSDITAVLVRLGYRGLIPLDFAGGSGYGDEAKVILRDGGVEIESLTAKPIDATSDSAFLPLGAKLGEAIDSGEIATALLAHWPGKACDSYHDLRRVASWSLALGKFWKLDDYFRDGEHPYHHGTSRAASPDAAQHLGAQIAAKAVDPLSSTADSFRQAVVQETEAKLLGLSRLICKSDPQQPDPQEPDAQQLPASFAKGVGCQATAGQPPAAGPKAMLLVNPHSIGYRDAVKIDGSVSAASDHVYGVSSESQSSIATVDIPACGFAVVQCESGGGSRGFSLGKMLGFGGPKPIVEQHNLQNEFMEVAISSESGGISGVYSGGSRGNRFSMRLVRSGDDHRSDSSDTKMRCKQLRVVSSTPAVGCIETDGEIVAGDDKPIARFKLSYTLRRGSRILSLSGELTPIAPLGSDPWHHYLAARVAVANEASICQLLLRDKVHRSHGRRLVCPLGVVLDEAERQTLITADGLPYQVRIGDRFVDTLLAVQGETNTKFKLNYGFDVSNPVAVAKSLISPPRQIPVSPMAKGSTRGWLIHTAPKEIVLNDLRIQRRHDGQLAAIVRVVQTRAKSCTAVLRFIHDVQHAVILQEYDEDSFDRPIETEPSPTVLKTKGDQVSLPMLGHQVVDVLVIFAGDSKS